MSALQDFWNKNTARIPYSKGQSIYSAEKEQQFPRTAVICDIGGGTGSDSLYFLEKGHTVTLIDIADSALMQAEKHAQERSLDQRLKTVQCDLSFGILPVDNESSDIAYSRLALHYFHSQVLSTLFSEVYRILRPGGRAFLTLKSPDDAAEMAFLTTTAVEEEEGLFNDGGRIKTRFTLERTQQILTNAGIPEKNCKVTRYVEALGNKNDIVKSGLSEFVVNEVVLSK